MQPLKQKIAKLDGRSPLRAASDTTPPQWCVGVVAAPVEGESLVVHSGGLRLRTQRAASCLLQPEPGDSVACLHCAGQDAWILAVLHRPGCAPHVLRPADGAAGLRIDGGGGSIDIHGGRIGLRADRLEGHMGSAAFTADTTEVVGRQLSVVAGRIKAVGQMLSTVMERVQHFSRSHVRTTDGIDRVTATHVEVEADQLMRLEAEHALVNGRSLVKARGAQIHFG